MKVVKAGSGKGLKVFIKNNYFEILENVNESTSIVRIISDYIEISNNTIQNSVIYNFIQMQANSALIQNI